MDNDQSHRMLAVWKSSHLWYITGIMAACSIFYYMDAIVDFMGWTNLRWDIFFTVHDLHRLLFLIPVAYAVYIFGLKGGITTVVISTIIFLPRAFLVSPYPDPLLRVIIFSIIMGILVILFAKLLNSSTENKQVAEKLKESEELYRTLIDMGGRVGEAIVMLKDTNDVKGMYTFISDKWIQIAGYTKEELLGRSFFDIVSPTDRRGALERHFRKMKGEVIPNHFELSIIRKDGIKVPIEITSGYTHYQGDRVNVAYIKDITEHKIVEEKLRESKEFNESLIASINDGYAMTDANGVHIDCNAVLYKMTGYSREELIGNGPPFPYWPEEEYENIQEVFNKTLSGQFADFELTFKRKNGERFPTIVSPSWVKDKKGNVICYFATIKDISQIKTREKFLKELEQKYRDLYDNAPVAYFSVGLNGLISSGNRAAQKWLGYSTEELHGMRFVDIYAEESYIKSSLLFNKLQRFESIESEELVCQKKNGEKAYGLLSVNPVFDGNGMIIANRSIVQDITERKVMEDEIVKYKESLEEVVKERTIALNEANKELSILYEKEKENRLAIEEQTLSKISFVRTLVHELKTPLIPMIGTSNILIDSLEDENLLRMAKNINRGANNLNRRIQDLMDFATGELDQIHLQYMEADPAKLLTDVAAYVIPEAERKKQHVSVRIKNHLPLIYMDEDRLHQVLLNLLNNALKFTPSDGHIIISGEVQGGKFIVAIEDEGCGIDEEDQKAIFKTKYNFKINKEKPDSLGLGLPLSKMLIELHGGEIWFESRKGYGSKFSFSLPIADTSNKK